jgi:hypothetical protein
MSYVKVTDGVATQYSLRQLRIDYPNTSFPVSPPDSTLAEYSVYPLTQNPAPSYDEDTQKIVLQDPTFVDGEWVLDYAVVDLTQEEIDARLEAWRNKTEVSMRQARLALLDVGLLSSVDEAIAGLPEPDKTTVSIEWEYSSIVDRASPWISAMAVALSMTEAEMDDLFKLAQTK